MAGMASRSMPMPVSRTEKARRTLASRRQRRSTARSTRPFSVNLTALPTRWASTPSSRASSPTRAVGARESRRDARTKPRARAATAKRPVTRPRASARSKGAGESAAKPFSNRVKSVMSSTTPSRPLAEIRILSR
ncbi:hypothetical protein DSECCO2_636010 [anaerobic digester metagenome]